MVSAPEWTGIRGDRINADGAQTLIRADQAAPQSRRLAHSPAFGVDPEHLEDLEPQCQLAQVDTDHAAFYNPRPASPRPK